MRRLVAMLALVGLPTALHAQVVPVRFAFETAVPAAGEAATVIARRQQLRAWQDTVEVYLEQVAPSANIRVAPANSPASFMVSIVAAPVAKPGASAFAIALVVFEPATFAPWRYLTHSAIYSESALDAATALVQQTVSAINARAQRR